MKHEQEISYQILLNEMMKAYGNYISEDKGTFDCINERNLTGLYQLIDLFDQSHEDKPGYAYSSVFLEIMKSLYDEFAAFKESGSPTTASDKPKLEMFKRMLGLNSENNLSFQKEMFPKVEAKFDNLQKVDLDFLNITRKLTNENAHSDILAALMDSDRCPIISSTFLANLLNAALYHSPNFKKTIHLNSGKPVFVAEEIKKIVRLLKAGELYTTCVREKTVDDGKRIDLLIKSRLAYIAIENKVYSYEHDKQTEEYYNWLERNCLGNIVPLGILLSPTRMSPSCHYFGILGFKDVKWSLVDALSRTEISEDEFLLGRSYLNSLEKLYI